MGGWNSIEVEGMASPGSRMSTSIDYVGPRFFETMGIPLLAGRAVQSGDTAAAPKVAIINQTFAREYFGGKLPVGRRFHWQGGKDWIEVVGVVGDIKFSSVRDEPPPVAYIPFLQSPWTMDMSFEVRTGTAAVAKEIYSVVHDLDPDLPVVDLRTQESQIDNSLNTERLFAELAGLFGALGLTLACVGLYGIMSYNVSHRTGEIGIRMALGADRKGILWLVLRQSFSLVLVGLAAGCVLALATTRLMASLLYGVGATSPAALCAGMIFLFLIAMLATYIPARRATKVDPMVALRYE
jgi:predicted permease